MKNLKIFAVSLIGLVLLTGCGTKTLTCTKTEEESGINMTQEMSMKFKKDKVTNIKMSINAKATDDDIKENWSLFTSMLGSAYEPADEEGFKLSVNDDESNYTYNILIEADLNKASESTLSKYDLEDILDSNDTLEDVKKDALEDGFTCK